LPKALSLVIIVLILAITVVISIIATQNRAAAENRK
jgi:hypothetical protein